MAVLLVCVTLLFSFDAFIWEQLVFHRVFYLLHRFVGNLHLQLRATKTIFSF